MPKHSALWLSLCLSSLAIAVSFVAATSVTTAAGEQQAIAQTNPCASSNPCASKVGNVGAPLAEQLQGKPVVVDIYASWCSACRNIAPTLSQLKQEYNGRVNFIVLDVSDRAKASQAETRARELGLGDFFAQNRSQTGMIAIIDPATGNILAQHRNNANRSAYTSVLNSALAQK
ncbi:MAG TPA: thioredoxin [Cyanobacteria bacterium UBA11369]|nr:thioredoxin [Cyanobacteria bacterium UBA11371]HBE30924.1 thioredoxin [Cyanobacteria bacterium UBA11368]HBE49198.1 thioredoxin [Cyanobacteria bacterium UBA11369]